MKKRLLSTMLTLCMVLTLTPGTALAAATSGSCGNGVTWSYSDGTLTIQGTGSMINYQSPESPVSNSTPPWDSFCNQIHTVKIDDGVTSIGDLAFGGCENMYSITIPDSVTSIGESSFWGCTSLTSVTIPDGVTINGKYTFFDCSNLTSVTIPDSIAFIDEGAFYTCRSLTNVTIPNSVTTIEDWVFHRCDSLTDVYYGGNKSQWRQITIDEKNEPLTNATIHYNSIEPEKHDTCGDNLTWILENGTLTISGTGEMRNYWTPMDSMFGTTLLDDAPWSMHGNEINNVVIQSGVTSIGNRAFFGCNVSSVIIPNSVISIGYGAFEQTRLTDVYYSGTEAGWRNISISYTDYRNELLRDANIYYNSTGHAPSTSNDISVTIDGKAVTWTDAAPFIDANSRTMVPLRAVADAMGLGVNWNASAREAAFTNGSKTIYFPIDSNAARTSNGGTVQMDTAAVIVNERTYAPIRYLAEYFGYEVGWDAATRTVTIK